MLDIDLAGPWTPDMYAEHLPDAIAFDEGLIRSIVESCQPHTALDLGCGLGYFVQFLRAQGVDSWGVEAANMGNSFKAPGYQIERDLSQPFDLEQKYDLVICLEVVEHIPHSLEDTVFDNIVRHVGKYLLFSGATPGQQGTGHINEQPESHWFAHLVRRGLRLVQEDTIQARLASQLPWYARNASLWEWTTSQDQAVEISQRDSQILECHRQLHEVYHQLRQCQAELESSLAHTELQTQLSEAQAKLDRALESQQQVETELARYQNLAEAAQTEVAAMQTSKFWKLRSRWFKLKRSFGFAADVP